MRVGYAPNWNATGRFLSGPHYTYSNPNQIVNAISLELQLTRASTRVDKSMSLSLSTPELNADEMTEIFRLQGKNLKCLFQPLEESPEALTEVKNEIEGKSPSQRLRGVLFCLWRHTQHPEPVEFSVWYKGRIEAYIEQIKAKLPQDQR